MSKHTEKKQKNNKKMSKHKLVFKIIALVTIQIFIFTTSASTYPILGGLSKVKKELRVPAKGEDPGELVESLGGNSVKQFVEDLIELKKGPYNQNWWEMAALEELSKNPTPWGDDAIIPVEIEKGIIKVRITEEMLDNWSKINSEGRNILSSFEKYEDLGPISIAGIRHTMNIANIHDTRQVKNSFERLLTSLSLGLMVKIFYNKGAGFPYQANYGHEVRYHSDAFQDITMRQLAAMGFICHVVPNNETIAIWDTSTIGKVFGVAVSFSGTASHAESNIDGLKIMDYEGSQFLISSIKAMIAIQRAIIEKIKDDGYVDFYLSAEDDPRITDQLYKVTDYGLDVYKKYQDATTCDELILDMVKSLDPTKIHIDCAHGAAYRTLPRFLEKKGLGDLVKKINWMHIEERSDFGNIGKLMENLKTGEDEIFDLGADGTQMYEKIMPNGKVIKYFPVLCTADYPERFAEMPIGDIILHTDMDHDRLYVTQILANNEETKSLLAEIGVVYNVINSDKVAAVFIPNKFFHLLHEMNFMRLTTLMAQGKVDKNRTLVVLKTLASTPAVDKWVEKRKEEGCNIVVINTAVGFAKLANVMYRAESQMRDHPGDDVIVYDASGKEINIGSDPLILAAWEESGGIITGVTYGFKDLLGNSFLASREKSATESIFLSLALISKLQKEKREVDLAAYLKELYIRDKIDTPIDLRFDNKLFVPGTTKEANEEEEAGNQRKNRIFGAYLSIVIAYMRDDINIEQAKSILRDIFEQEHQARKEQSKNPLAGVLIERFKNVDIDSLIDIKFTGDGVMFIFEKEDRQWFVLFRPSGTEPKLKSYGFGEDTERLTVDAWVFAFNENIAGSLPQRFTKNEMLMELWGKDGTKAVEKALRMQNAWEEFGLVVDLEDLTDSEQAKLEKRRLVRRFSPPDNHLEMINQWLENEGLNTIDINLNSPQAMPQKAIVALLEAIPEPIYKKLGRTKEEVISKEKEKRYASNVNALEQTISQLIQELEEAKKSGKVDIQKQLRSQLDQLISEVNDITSSTYDLLAEKYIELRGQAPEGKDLKMIQEFLKRARQTRLAGAEDKLSILDVGTGIRDLTWFSQQDNVSATGIDFSRGVVEAIRERGKTLSVLQMDMKQLGFANGIFEGIRFNATLHHLPLIDSQQGADTAIQEAYRVLKPGGISYILVKAETDEHRGFMGLDSKEGFGKRFYQFYSKESLKTLLERNGFVLSEEIEEWTDNRGKKNLIAFAQKPVFGKDKIERYALDKHNLSEVEKEAGKAMEQISKEGMLEALTLMSGKEKADLEELKTEKPELKTAIDKFAKIGFDGDNARLGWFGAVKWILKNPAGLGELNDLIEEKRKAGAKNFIFCGMGGSVLCVDTVRGTFKEIEGLPVIQTLSDTDPDGVRAVIDFARRNDPNLRNTYVVVTSKSGTTAETLSHLEVWERVLTEAKVKLEDKVIILTDSGSPPYETSFWQKRAEKLKRAYAEIEIAPYINNPKILTIQLDEGTDIGGRFTAPATRLFLLAAGLRGKNLEDLVQRAAELSEISEPKDNPFIELGVIFYSLAQKGIDQITLILPEELKEIAPWAEQLFEEGLGKDNKGLHIIYGEEPNLTAYKDVDANDRIFLRFKLAGKKDANETFVRQLKEKKYPLIEQEIKDDLDITKVMYGLGETVATIAYLWDINFVDQPAVVLYKNKTKEYAEKDRNEIVNDLKARKDKKIFQDTGITVYYDHLLEQKIVNQEALESELNKLGRNLENASAEEVTAAIMRIVMAEEDIKCIDTRYYGYDKEIRPVLEDWRNVVKRIFRRATKVSKGPDINHSGEQNAVAGLKGLRLINVAVPEKARRLSFGEFSYDDKLLIASALGTVDAQTEAGRPALLVTLPDLQDLLKAKDERSYFARKEVPAADFAKAFPNAKVKLNKEKLTEGPMAFIIDPALIGDNPSLALAIQNLKDQLGDKVRIVLQHSRKSEKLGAEALYEAIKKATDGAVDLEGKVDWAAPAKASPEEIIKEVQKRFENVGSIRVVGRQKWTKGFEGIERPGLEKITLVVCKIGEGSKSAQGDLGILLALKDTGLLPKKEMAELNRRWSKGGTFFIVETKEIAEEMEYIEKYQEALKKFE